MSELTVSLERLIRISTHLLSDYDGSTIEFEVDDDYPLEDDGSAIIAVTFYKNGDYICKLFNDTEIMVEEGCLLIEADNGYLHKARPYYELDVFNILTSKASEEDAAAFMQLLEFQTKTYQDSINENDS